jgi:formate--tetrahydrofolate ligase
MMHSGRYTIRPGHPLDPGLMTEDLEVLTEGSCNLRKQIANVRAFGVPVVVAVNRFPTDTDAEHELIRTIALDAGACAAVSHTMHADGGAGGEELAQAIEAASGACENTFTLTYPDELPIREKIEAIATRVYSADGVDFSPAAARAIQVFTGMGFERLPICMAKTHLSLSHDPVRTGCPTGWRLPVRDVRLSAGAGYLYALCGDIMTMPGLPSHPAGEGIDIDADGNIVGLS